jgi:hypothetical protein
MRRSTGGVAPSQPAGASVVVAGGSKMDNIRATSEQDQNPDAHTIAHGTRHDSSG